MTEEINIDAGLLGLWQNYCDKKMECEDLREEVSRLQRIIDSRPAINAGLTETYIRWSQGIMQTDIARAINAPMTTKVFGNI